MNKKQCAASGLALLLSLALVSCGQTEQTAESTEAGGEITTSSAPATPEEKESPSLKEQIFAYNSRFQPLAAKYITDLEAYAEAASEMDLITAAVVLDEIQADIVAMSRLDCPLPEVNREMREALRLYSLGYELWEYGLDNLDPAAMNRGVNKVEHGNEHLANATEILKAND